MGAARPAASAARIAFVLAECHEADEHEPVLVQRHVVEASLDVDRLAVVPLEQALETAHAQLEEDGHREGGAQEAPEPEVPEPTAAPIRWRAASNLEGSFPAGYEAQINSTGHDPVKTGSLFNLPPIEEMLVKPDEWLTQEVIAQGNHIVILLNGNKVVNYVGHAKTYTTGHLALQHAMRSLGNDTLVQFRKIEVRELPDVGP
jgi:Domain of Unknown Function (DUF1080)